jgi:hypothetical protein
MHLPAEQRRHQVRWTSGAFRTASRAATANCHTCRHVTRLSGHRCQKHGFTTMADACCPDYSRAPAA